MDIFYLTQQKNKNQGFFLATNTKIIVKNICDKLSWILGKTGKLINDKFKNFLVKSNGFEVIQQISNILINEITVTDRLLEDLSIQD